MPRWREGEGALARPGDGPPDEAAVAVTALPANHCPGSVMLLFQPAPDAAGPARAPPRRPRTARVLYTGDVRLEEGMLAALSGGAPPPDWAPAVYSRGDYARAGEHLRGALRLGLDRAYVDTTYDSCPYDVPARRDAMRDLRRLARGAAGAGAPGPVCVALTKLGKEEVLGGAGPGVAAFRRRRSDHAAVRADGLAVVDAWRVGAGLRRTLEESSIGWLRLPAADPAQGTALHRARAVVVHPSCLLHARLAAEDPALVAGAGLTLLPRRDGAPRGPRCLEALGDVAAALRTRVLVTESGGLWVLHVPYSSHSSPAELLAFWGWVSAAAREAGHREPELLTFLAADVAPARGDGPGGGAGAAGGGLAASDDEAAPAEEGGAARSPRGGEAGGTEAGGGAGEGGGGDAGPSAGGAGGAGAAAAAPEKHAPPGTPPPPDAARDEAAGGAAREGQDGEGGGPAAGGAGPAPGDGPPVPATQILSPSPEAPRAAAGGAARGPRGLVRRALGWIAQVGRGDGSASPGVAAGGGGGGDGGGARPPGGEAAAAAAVAAAAGPGPAAAPVSMAEHLVRVRGDLLSRPLPAWLSAAERAAEERELKLALEGAGRDFEAAAGRAPTPADTESLLPWRERYRALRALRTTGAHPPVRHLVRLGASGDPFAEPAQERRRNPFTGPYTLQARPTSGTPLPDGSVAALPPRGSPGLGPGPVATLESGRAQLGLEVRARAAGGAAAGPRVGRGVGGAGEPPGAAPGPPARARKRPAPGAGAPEQTPSKRGRKRWSVREVSALRRGVERYGRGNWASIRGDAELGAALRDRSAVDLKDKWRNLGR